MTGFYTQTKEGNIAHIHGDRKMSDETLAALHVMIDAVYKQHPPLKCPHCGGWILVRVTSGTYKCTSCGKTTPSK